MLEDNDRLPLETKWLFLPLLLGSQVTFNKATTPYQTFSDLVKTRNQRLVHFKPAKETRITRKKYKQEYFSEFVGNINLAEKYIGCVKDMILELHQLTKGKTAKPNFLKGPRYTSTIQQSFTVHTDS